MREEMREMRERRERREIDEREMRGAHAKQCNCTHLYIHTPSHCSTSHVSSEFDPWSFQPVESELLSDSMSKTRTVDPLFLRAHENLSKAAQRNVSDTGLLDPAVLACNLDDPDTGIDELAPEPGNEAKLQELLRQARRAAEGQRAEFARRGLDEFVRQDKARKAAATKQKADRLRRRHLRGTAVACPHALPEAQN